MLFFIFVYIAGSQVQADILEVNFRAGKTRTVETGFSSANFTLGLRLRENVRFPDRFIFKSGIFGFGNAQFSGFLQLYFAKNPAVASRVFSSAAARIYDDASAESFVFSAAAPQAAYLLVYKKNIADNIFAITFNNLDTGIIVSKKNFEISDDYYSDGVPYTSVIRPFADIHIQTDILRIYLAGLLNCSANLPLSAMVSTGIRADLAGFNCNFVFLYWSEHYINSSGEMSDRFAENSVSLQKIFSKLFAISLSNHLVLEKIASYEMYSDSSNISADNETIVSVCADPFSFFHVYAKSGLSVTNTEFDNLELKHTAGFRLGSGIASIAFTVHYRETKFIEEYSFLVMLGIRLKHADIRFTWKPEVYFRMALALSYSGFGCKVAARINKKSYEAEIGFSLKNL